MEAPVFAVKPAQARGSYDDSLDEMFIRPIRSRGGWIDMYHREGHFVIQVSTAPGWAWQSDKNESFETLFYPYDRNSFRCVYQMARTLLSGQPFGDLPGYGYMEVGSQHERLLYGDCLLDAAGYFKCRHCGANDCGGRTSFFEWSQPDVCAACELFDQVMTEMEAMPLALPAPSPRAPAEELLIYGEIVACISRLSRATDRVGRLSEPNHGRAVNLLRCFAQHFGARTLRLVQDAAQRERDALVGKIAGKEGR